MLTERLLKGLDGDVLHLANDEWIRLKEAWGTERVDEVQIMPMLGVGPVQNTDSKVGLLHGTSRGDTMLAQTGRHAEIKTLCGRGETHSHQGATGLPMGTTQVILDIRNGHQTHPGPREQHHESDKSGNHHTDTAQTPGRGLVGPTRNHEG